MTCWILWGLLILVFYTMESKSDRPVVNTTCLELAKPSNQPLRLTCQPGYYHCLLDENYNREFEVCREWKWIPGGKCAYFNSYGNGNVDERVCQQQPNLTCSPGGQQFSSADNTKYTACYVKKATTPAVPSTTSSSQVTGIHDRENSTASPGKSEESSHVEMQVLASVLGILVPVLILSFCVIYFVFIHPKRSHHKKGSALADPESSLGKKSDSKEDAQTPKGNTFSPEQEPLMSSENAESLPPKSDADNTSKCEEEENFSTPNTSPSMIRKESKEDPESDNASDAESVEVFDDTMESLTTKVQTTDEKEIELRQELYHLLEEGRELAQEVLQLVITSAFDKTPEELVSDNTIKTILKNIMPEESHRFLSYQTESRTSIDVLYGLIQLYPGMEPQSGWGEPVKGSDTGISDDVERLYRIHSIFKEISNAILISVENYVRLLNIMLTAVTSLDCDGKLEDKYEVLAGKLEKISNPNWSQFLFKKFNGFIKQWKI